jgi:murein hydrolase activator
MKQLIFFVLSIIFFNEVACAQANTREDLEKQRIQLKKEIEQTEKMLSDNKSKTKENLVQWKLVNDKVNLQDKVIDNISKDINLLDNNMYKIQRDINRYDKLMDTLKQEYAKSMVYAYKNRSNYDFLNFIFSAGSFNDAMKRVSYLKSYRTYREMQGGNILRTQELRRQRIEELGGAKVKKGEVLQDQSKEMNVLEQQKAEKDKLLNALKKQGKQLNDQYAANKKKMAKVSSAITAAIERARKEAIAKAAVENKRKAEEAKRLAAANKANTTTTTTKPNASTTPRIVTPIRPREAPKDILLNSDNLALNTSFEKNKGSLPWPVENPKMYMHYGLNELPSGTKLDNPGLTIATSVGAAVKAVFDGVVTTVANIEEMQIVIIQHGQYFSTYSNLNNVVVQKGQNVKTGQTLGKALPNDDGIGSIDLIMSNEKGNNVDPAKWLRNK